MLILHLLHPIFPSTVSGATWSYTFWPRLPLEELFHHGVVRGCHKTWAHQLEALWMGFQLQHPISKAALRPSSQCCSTGTTCRCPCHLPALFILCRDDFPRNWGLPSAQRQPPSGCHATSLPPGAGAKPSKPHRLELRPATREY